MNQIDQITTAVMQATFPLSKPTSPLWQRIRAAVAVALMKENDAR